MSVFTFGPASSSGWAYYWLVPSGYLGIFKRHGLDHDALCLYYYCCVALGYFSKLCDCNSLGLLTGLKMCHCCSRCASLSRGDVEKLFVLIKTRTTIMLFSAVGILLFQSVLCAIVALFSCCYYCVYCYSNLHLNMTESSSPFLSPALLVHCGSRFLLLLFEPFDCSIIVDSNHLLML